MKKILNVIALVCLFSLTTIGVKSQNPIICDRYTPDPAPYVHGDTLYLFVDHDEDVTENGYFTMKDWLLYSTVDMVNWTYRGTPITGDTFKAWAKTTNDCWASQCIERDGKWYWYCTATIKNQAYPGIGVAVANHPAGPYRDAIKKPLVQGWFKIDPTVIIDDDGQAYLFYGNNMLWYAKLTKRMTAITGGEIEVPTKDVNAFGPYKGYDDNGNPKTNFEEASWIYKRNGKYFLEYAAGGVPEHWAYSTADKVTGPWTYQGKVLGQADNSFTIHGGTVEYKGHNYIFYHNGKLPGGGGYTRATCVEEFTRNADGTIPFINFTTQGVAPLQTLNPFEHQEAETINQCSGVKCMGDYNGCYVTDISSADYIKVRNVDFTSDGAKSITVRVRSERKSTLVIRTGSRTGNIKGRVTIESTNGEWTDFTFDLTSAITGVQDLFFTFSGSGASLFDFDSWQFSKTALATNAAQSIQVGDETRQYWLHVPSHLKSPCPVVMALHGASGKMEDNSPNFNSIADKEGFIVVYPQGNPIYFPVFGGTVTGWDASGEENVDVDFIKAVLADVSSRYDVDSKRFYCCGFSNGGMMTYALTNTCSDIFAAFASISGFPLNEFHYRHTGTRPFPFLHIHGKADDFVKYSLMPKIVDEVVARLGANPIPTKTTSSGKYDKSIYAATEGSFPYTYYEIDGMGHNDFTANTEKNSSSQTMWEFFKQYTLDTPCDTALKWMPRLETEGYDPTAHGWTMNKGTTLLRFGEDQNTTTNQNVYYSLQLTSGIYKLHFTTDAAAGKKVTARIQKLTGKKNYVLNASTTDGGDADFLFTVSDGWGEYRLTILRPSSTDAINISNLQLTSATPEEITSIKGIRSSDKSKSDEVYDLQGRRVPEPLIKEGAGAVSKGVYVAPGKKVLVK